MFKHLLLIAIFCTSTNSFGSQQGDSHLIGLHTDIPIGVLDGIELSINIAFPRNGSHNPRPVILLIHGGGFVSGDKDSKNAQIQKLSELGYVSASAMYRLSPEFRFPSAIEDIRLAVRFLKANAKIYNIDAERIIVSGSSAGSYLAVMVGVTGNSNAFSDHGLYSNYDSSVRAVAAQSAPIADFTLAKHRYSPTVKRLTNPAAKDFEKTLVAMSPKTYLDPNDPPFFISHGDSDTKVPVAMSREFVSELEKIGHSFIYYEVKGGTHSFNRSAPRQAKKLFAKYLDFLKKWTE